MHSQAFRRIARLFATALLLWTAADVCDYGLCSHHRDPINAFAQTALRESSPDGPSGENGPGDCFCCSHVVDVRTPFRIALGYEFVWGLPDESAGPPHLTPVPHYHPPLA